MPTIASPSPPQRPPPGDADLQELYNQVLSAFAEESSPTSFSPTLSISRNVDHDAPLYSPHSDEGIGSHLPSSSSSSRPPLPRSRASASPLDSNRPLPSPTTYPTSPTLGKGFRPLPRLPPTTLSSSSTYPSHMPDPQLFFPDTTPPVSTGARPSTEPSRRQYAADPLSNGATTSYAERSPPPRGLPSDPRPIIRSPQDCAPAAAVPLMRAHPRPALDTLVLPIRFSTPCPLLILPLLDPMLNPGIHRPPAGIIPPTVFNPPGVACRRSLPTGHLALRRPEYLVTPQFSTPAMIRPPLHYHQTYIRPRVTLALLTSLSTPITQPIYPLSLIFPPRHHSIHLCTLKPQHGPRTSSNVIPRRISLFQEITGMYWTGQIGVRRCFRFPAATIRSNQPALSPLPQVHT
ncbi:hypothetical protein BJV74DRAFT_593773 [Russula compacta]|nr:hypothetical protein BJV74DRAFT_593773 [Russula compacta]